MRAEDGLLGSSSGVGLTKRSELVLGRLAMIALAVSVVLEGVLGRGVLAQLHVPTAVPLAQAEAPLLALLVALLLGSVGALGDRGRFVDGDEPEPRISDSVRDALGLGEKAPPFKISKASELFVGRLAQLGLAVSLGGELLTGMGPLAHLNVTVGAPLWDLDPHVLLPALALVATALNPGTGEFVDDDGMNDARK